MSRTLIVALCLMGLLAPEARAQTIRSGSQAAPLITWVVRTRPPVFQDGLAAKSAPDAAPEDPGNDLALKIADLVAPKLNARVSDKPVDPERFADLRGSPLLTGVIQYVVNVRTRTFEASPVNGQHVRLHYVAAIDLFDTTASKSVYTAACDVRSKDRPDLPTHDQALADDGKLLKVLISEVSDQCLADVVKGGLGGPKMSIK